MPYCPKCKEEYRTEIVVCPECKVALTEKPAAVADDEIEDLAVAFTVSEEDSAHIIRGFLESEGIPCQIENMTFHMAPAGELTKVRLWTKTGDAGKARRLIDEHESFNFCSSCGHVALAEDEACDFCGEKFEG